ncbi:MAG: hypothetical protein ACKO37_02800, partial [Vampirovibrionales bacterium]
MGVLLRLSEYIRTWTVPFFHVKGIGAFLLVGGFIVTGFKQPLYAQTPVLQSTQELTKALQRVKVSPLETPLTSETLPLLDEQEETQYGMQALCVQIRILFRIADQALLQNHFHLALEVLEQIQLKQVRLKSAMTQLGLTSAQQTDADIGYLLLPLSMRHPIELEGLEAPHFKPYVAQEALQDVFQSKKYRKRKKEALATLPDDATVLQRFITTIEHLQKNQSQKIRLSQHELEQLHILLLQQELSVESLRQAFSHPWIQAFLLARKAMSADATRMTQLAYLQEASHLLHKPFFSPSLIQT